MLSLGIDTAGRRAGVAIVRDQEILATRCGSGPHSALLLPMIAELFSSHELMVSQLSLIGVTRGPGAYTGLRVGIVTAKALSRSTGAPVVGVPTLEAMARQAPAEAQRVMVALHAYKSRLLVAWFERDQEALVQVVAPALITADQLDTQAVDKLNQSESAVITDAPQVIPQLDQWDTRIVPYDHGAISVAELAQRRHEAGATSETYTLTPDYLRPPSVTLKPGGQNAGAPQQEGR
jgi:tRNA threonylcarbamoyladenosine biosynthesis protein TsaB